MRKKASLSLACVGLFLTLIPLTTGAQQPLMDDRQVYVVGNVVKPMAIPFKEPITLTRAISVAGGPLKDAKYDKVIIVRSFDKNRIRACVSLRKINRHRISDVQIQANDVLEVVRGDCQRSMCWEILPGLDQLPLRVIR